MTEQKSRLDVLKRMTWYKRPAVWAVVLSAIAIVLSQFPPVPTWIPRTQFTAQVGNTIALPVTFGIPSYQLLVHLENTGNRTMSLSNFNLEVEAPNGSTKSASGNSFFVTGDESVFSLMTVKLKPEEAFEVNMIFTAPRTPSDDEKISRMSLQIPESILSKRRKLSLAENDLAVVADPVYVTEAVNFFNTKFDLDKGIYKAWLTCEANGSMFTVKEFQFLLYDYHIQLLKSQTDDYKYGLGVGTRPTNKNKVVWASISNLQ